MGKPKMNFNDFKEKNKQQEEKNHQNNKNNGNRSHKNNDEKKSKISEIMEGIKQTGYRNEAKTVLRKELVSTEAENIAKELKKEKLSKSQLRSFFNEINKLKSKYIEGTEEEEQEKLENLGIELLILKSKLEYKKGKSGNDKLPENFYIFMKESIDYIVENDKKIYFKDFKIFFETVVGYTYGLGGVNNR